MSLEPGLDEHSWRSQYELILEEVEGDPTGALVELADLVEEMLEEREYHVHDPVADEGDEPEVLVQYRAARDIADRVERGTDLPPEDVEAAIEGLVALFDHVEVNRSAP